MAVSSPSHREQRMDTLEASLDGRCGDLDGRIGNVEQRLEAAEKVEQRVRAMEQHMEVLQAQVDALQSQLLKEFSRSEALSEALRRSNAELRQAQMTSAEATQAALELLAGKLDRHGGSDHAECASTEAPVGSALDGSFAATSLTGSDCTDTFEQLQQLRAKLARVANDLSVEPGLTPARSPSRPGFSARSSAPGPGASPPRAPRGSPQSPGRDTLAATNPVPTLLGRAAPGPGGGKVPPGAGGEQSAAAGEALAAALVKERELSLSARPPALAGADFSLSPEARRRRPTGSYGGAPLGGGGGGSLSFAGPPRLKSPIRRLQTTGSVDSLSQTTGAGRRTTVCGAGQFLNEISELREMNLALREENIEIRDRMLRQIEGQEQQAAEATQATQGGAPQFVLQPRPPPQHPVAGQPQAAPGLRCAAASVALPVKQAAALAPPGAPAQAPRNVVAQAPLPPMGNRAIPVSARAPVLQGRIVVHR